MRSLGQTLEIRILALNHFYHKEYRLQESNIKTYHFHNLLVLLNLPRYLQMIQLTKKRSNVYIFDKLK